MKIVLILNSLCLAYLWALAFFGIRVKRNAAARKLNKFAILIPAHNEAKNILPLIDSIKRFDYPKDLYDCYCVADHCSDDTAAVTAKAGIACYEKKDGFAGKGRALSWLIDKVLTGNANKYDAFIFFDADNTVDADFLNVMNSGLCGGNEIMQGYPDVSNWKSSVFTILNYINYITVNRLKENARSNLGLSCRLRGHGMCFAASALKNYNWATDSSVEDHDLFTQIIASGKKVVWEHRAKVYSVLPQDTRTAEKQRMRWSKAKHSWLAIPQNSVLIGIAGISFILSISWWSSAILLLYLAYFLFGSLLEGMPIRYFLYFIASPFFILWRVWIFALSFRKAKALEWR